MRRAPEFGPLGKAVPGAGRQVAHDQAAEPVDHPGSHLGIARVQDGQVCAGRGTGDVGLPDRPVTVERQQGRGGEGVAA